MYRVIYLLLATGFSLYRVVPASILDDSSENLLAADTEDDYYATSPNTVYYATSPNTGRSLATGTKDKIAPLCPPVSKHLRKRRPGLLSIALKIGSILGNELYCWVNDNRAIIMESIKTAKRWNTGVYVVTTIAVAAGLLSVSVAGPIFAAVFAVKVMTAIAETAMEVATSDDKWVVKGLKVMLTAVTVGVVDLGDAQDTLSMVGFDGSQVESGAKFLKEMGELCTQSSSVVGVAEAAADLGKNTSFTDVVDFASDIQKTAGIVVDLTLCQGSDKFAGEDFCQYVQKAETKKPKLDPQGGEDDPDIPNDLSFLPCGDLLAHLTSAPETSLAEY